MTENKIKIIVGLFLIIAQIGIFLSILILFVLGGFLFDEMTTSIALIMPMFSIYTTAIVKYILANRHSNIDSSKVVNKSYVLISLFLPVLFVALLEGAVFFKAYNIAFSSFEQFKTLLAMLEAIFGVYIGLVISSMYTLDTKGKTNE